MRLCALFSFEYAEIILHSEREERVMQIIEMKLADLVPYENNPRRNEQAVDAVANSIREFGFKVPIIVDRQNVIVAGHTRARAAEQLGLKKVPVVIADDLTEEQIKAFRLADNKTAELATWDFAKLEEELQNISDIDMGDFGFEEINQDYGNPFDEYPDGEKGALSARFVVPPFSVLDQRQGYWTERKRKWKKILGDLSETRDGEFGKFTRNGGIVDMINGGTSNFDPVLTEVMYKWFCPDGGKILDPFGGEQTKGVVAGELGYEYTAVEIREDQVELNRKKTAKYSGVKYICGDSNDIDKLIKDDDFDFCFTSPPYYDLEVYSKDDMSSLGSYDEFMRQYKNIFAMCAEKLKDNSFLAVKVGEIRDKKTGIYRGFVPDNIRVMTEIGLNFYNELILVSPVGTAALRASKGMRTRKVVKQHQNILVFFKGDPQAIMNKYPIIEYSEEDFLNE